MKRRQDQETTTSKRGVLPYSDPMAEGRDSDSHGHSTTRAISDNMRSSAPTSVGERSNAEKNLQKTVAAEAVAQQALSELSYGTRSADWQIRRLHVVPTDLPFCQLQCKEAWNSLTSSQKHFVHHFSRASWTGSLICFHQLSKESPDILQILLLLFSSTGLQDLKTKSCEAGVTQKEWEYFIAYTTCFLANLGNYLAFGDLKIVPGLMDDKFDAIVNVCPLQDRQKERLVSLWEERRRKIYSLAPGERNLGFPPGGCTRYYSEDLTSEEVKLVSEWMNQASIEPWNTRIWRTKRTGSGKYGSLPGYDIRIASSLEFPTTTHLFQSKCVIHVVYGDFKEVLVEVVKHLRNALPYADNLAQREILNCFIQYMETGSIETHKRSQEIWLKQKDVLLEFNLGFIETYRDPCGFRAEFEGFVGTVNKAATKQFAMLIEKVDLLLPFLPWPKDYEAEKYFSPAFTCIEVFLYANGIMPAGVNLPNYESVRQKHGSRSLCLSNVSDVHDSNMKTTFLTEEDIEISKGSKADVFLIQLAFHEFLGHGSGKLFTQDKRGDYNYLRGKVMHPITDEAVMTCYRPGETWNSIFGQISGAFEECRAECVGLVLSTYPQALEVLGHVGGHAEDIMYINWLMMARAGLLALEFVSLDSGEWRQAHMQARFGILRTLLRASALEAERNASEGVENGKNLLDILPRGRNDLVLHLNRDKIRTVGLPAIRDLLLKLQVYRSTADVERGRELFNELTTVPNELLKFRRPMLANKRPRPMFVQMNTKLVEEDGGSRIEMQEFAPTAEGLIQSYLAHFEDPVAACTLSCITSSQV